MKKDESLSLYSWRAQGAYDPVEIKNADGVFFWDSRGKRYFDMSSQLVNVNLGHNNKKIIEGIKEQADKICYISPDYRSEARDRLAEKIIGETAPKNMGKVFFTLSGAESNEHALKIAKAYTGKYKIMSAYRSYHGSTLGAANLSGEARRFSAEPGPPCFVKFFAPYLYREKIKFKSEKEVSLYYLSKLEEQILFEGADRIAALFVESVVGSNGVIIPPDGYMEGLRALCTKYRILLVCDEVMTGWCRTGKWFGCQNWDIEPDMITFSKGVTGGYVPLGGVIISKEIASYFDSHPFISGLTYSGYPIGCAAGCAAVEEYKELGFPEKAAETGKYLKKELGEISESCRCAGECRSVGLLGAVELVKDKKSGEPLFSYGKDRDNIMRLIIGELMDEGFATYSHDNFLMVAPPLIIAPPQLHEAMSILKKVLKKVDSDLLGGHL